MMRHRHVNRKLEQALLEQGVNPLLSRVYAARELRSVAELQPSLHDLLRPDSMADMQAAVDLLFESIQVGAKLLVIADYDCDGATACAVAVRGLRMMQAKVDYLVPNRLVHGYGLSPEIVALAMQHPRIGKPDLLITVDHGIASHEGISAAAELGVPVLVTDHHLPGDLLPDAKAIVNPNRTDCRFESKHLAGVGVMFYVLLALRRRFRDVQSDHPAASAALQQLLDLVALGTVADLVKLDGNNRALVHAGLQRIRQGKAQAGVNALISIAGRNAQSLEVADLGFALAPRINAAGRLKDISVGIECLLAEHADTAHALARELDLINRERQNLQADMQQQALEGLEDVAGDAPSLVVFNEAWHEGIVGLLASRIKDQFHRPVLALAPAADKGLLRGSGRSIAGLHLRDALDWISKRSPQTLLRFGGHAMAAGFTIRRESLQTLEQLFAQAVSAMADPEQLEAIIWTDGSLEASWLRADWIQSIHEAVWGQGFPAPLFQDQFDVLSQQSLAEKHLKLRLQNDHGVKLEAIAFGRREPLERRIRAAYRLEINRWQGRQTLQCVLEHIEAL
ncbi:MAG: single-stranded-DNA-specific exonuclease RecJ [Betaproteobacteria bacterium]|nr:single-stranded-DNA-specific exonuclease RecJ [Betaproteobacteria bacterium]NBO44403.1 single-stranded-DNA-specific exonuclease RecJ [Betaproteobacteria bacterium]NBP10246.1 single-stranded-DNA-specific exonuclease RecJ [Betaproteobacteria bacterium]NBQ09698.1 single-stranded-DNA-specific exonuclease RecJ [Betaproteobacteria bacterium]NBQ80414.1 single-stranded-DNA-specific exonuclease RecJ [Betaproteobacteria bacterium]